MTTLFEAAELRDRGIEKVTLNNLSWSEQALAALPRIARQIGNFTGESMRIELEACLGPIPNPHLAGALINAALRKGLIARTGRRVKMETPKSHCRSTDEYRGV